jgi:hypothetical protein
VLREEGEGRPLDLPELDEPVLVGLEEAGRVVGEAGGPGEEAGELVLLLDDRRVGRQ